MSIPKEPGNLCSEMGQYWVCDNFNVYISIFGRSGEEEVVHMLTLEERIRKLPPSLQREMDVFVEYLEQKKSKRVKAKLQQDWAGALKDFRSQYTSMELQKKALEWRGD